MDLVRAAVDQDPGGLALDDGHGLQLDYHALDERVSEVGGALAADGITVGSRVALLTVPRADQVVWLHAIWRLGAVAVPLHPRSTEPEVSAALVGIEPDLVITDAVTAGLVRGYAAVDGAELSGGRTGARTPAASTASATDAETAAIVWTSGTDGRPRGVAIPWGAIRFNARASRDRLRLLRDDRWYASLSIAHVGGLVLVARAAALGSAVVLPGPFSPEDFFRLADEGRVTHASLVPVMLERLLAVRGAAGAPPSLRVLLVGGGGAPTDLIERACRAGYPVAPTYGLTEASSQVATATPDEACARPDTVGRRLPGVDVRIAEDGEILVRGASLATGYVGDPSPLTDDDGWLHTGDLGDIDADGMLRVLGRRGDRVVTGGVSVDPFEVEAEIRRIDGVADACVLGVPDPEWGERLVALIEWDPRLGDDELGVTANGHDNRRGADIEDRVRDALRARLRPEKIPKQVHVVAVLPRNRNGKLDRTAARTLVEGVHGRP